MIRTTATHQPDAAQTGTKPSSEHPRHRVSARHLVTAFAVPLTCLGVALAGAPAASASTLDDSPRMIVQDSGNNQAVETGHAFSTLVARVIDGAGDGVPGAPVTFSIQAPSGTQTGTADFPNGAQSITVTTDADGYAHNTASSGLTAEKIGDLTISASTPGLAAAAFPETVTAPLPMVQYLSGDAQVTGTRMPFNNPVVARVVDEYGTPLAGWPVTFALKTTTYDTASATFADGSATASAVTDSAGRVTSPLITAGSQAGDAELVTSASDHSEAVSNLTVTDAPAASISISGGDAQTAQPNGAFADALQATVLDASGHPVQGSVSVRFAITGSPAQFADGSTSTTVRVAGDGTATAPQLVAGPLAGPTTVRATVVGSAVPGVSFQESIG